MPIYEYQCQSCGKELEALQKISDAPLENCPACGAASLQKKVSAVAFRLKGGGWYETDFKTGNKKNLAGGGDASAAAGPSTASTPAAGDKSPATGAGTSNSTSTGTGTG